MDDRAAARSRGRWTAPTTRRGFLKVAALTAGAAGATAVLPAAPANAASTEELAKEHVGDRAMLIDVSRCIGCGACVAACKVQNHLQWRDDQPVVGSDARLASENWTVVRTESTSKGDPRFVKAQCMHCLEPACASACFVKAMHKSPEGPVVYDADRCVGCRYCMMACPFGVPTFHWEDTFPAVSKCNQCFTEGSDPSRPTACSQACPAGAITFGTRGRMLEEAHARIAAEPKKYEPSVYGETEAGGTSSLYVSDIPFAELGFKDVPQRPLPDYTWQVSRLVPPVGAGLAVIWAVIYARRRKLGLEPAEPEEET